MLEFITKAGSDILINLLQMAASSVVILLSYSIIKKVKGNMTVQVKKPAEFLLIGASSLLGLLLPLNTFALLPVLFLLLQLGLGNHITLPALFSNMIFNMLIPYTDPTFVWRTGFRRAALAFIIGAAAGLILKYLSDKGKTFKVNKIDVVFEQPLSRGSIVKFFNRFINATGLYLIIGVLLNTAFNHYIIYDMTSEAFTNPHTSFIPNMFAQFNVANPVFLLALNIAYSLMDLANLSAVLVILKLRSFIIYIAYFAVWAALLACSMFF